MNKKWLMTNRGPYRIIRRSNDVNFVVQRLPTTGMEIVHIDRLTRFHGTVPKLWKQVLRKEQEIAHELSASENKTQKNAIDVAATLELRLSCQSERSPVQALAMRIMWLIRTLAIVQLQTRLALTLT